MKNKLFLFLAILGLSFLTVLTFTSSKEEESTDEIEYSDRESKAIPIMAFDIFQLFLK
jgi:hypothetical protein